MTTLDDSIDLGAYFSRIGYSGSHEASVGTLAAIQARHMACIPFENLDPLLDRPVRLDLPSLAHKLVHSRRGGYCFEQNLLFSHAIGRLGIEHIGLAARVLWNQPADEDRPRSHMLLLATLDGVAYIADVGFGGHCPSAPLRLDSEAPQQTPHGNYRLRRYGADYILLVDIDDAWRPVYRFDLCPQLPVDYVAANYYLSTSDDSHFRHGLYAALATPGERRALLGHRYTVRKDDGSSARRDLSDADEIAAVLREEFGIAVPDMACFRAVVANGI